ncbi:hypothetical protein C8E83_0884 [Frondihabitans australicus]|uniref:DUF3558 domain-containing protein n=1 Tax=Frondihabitans australicus TaxID=386892 RepID=A0A495ICQ8_9MICO|nr:hypothetical protein C8E83_0884 [Frondihabitans australicus]
MALGALTVPLLLAGCTGSGAPTGAASHTPQASAASTPTPTPTGAAGSAPLDATALSIPCDTLAPASVLTIYSGMTADAKPKPPAESDAAVIAADDGTVCTWTSSSGDTMTLAVGQYSDASLTRLKNALVTSSQQVPTYAGEGYFSLDGKTGTAEAFTGSYWVVAISDTAAFGEPGGAEPIVDSALGVLKARG